MIKMSNTDSDMKLYASRSMRDLTVKDNDLIDYADQRYRLGSLRSSIHQHENKLQLQYIRNRYRKNSHGFPIFEEEDSNMAGDGSWPSNMRKNSLSQQMFSQSVSDHMSLYSGMNSRYKVKGGDSGQAKQKNPKDILLRKFVREISAN